MAESLMTDLCFPGDRRAVSSRRWEAPLLPALVIDARRDALLGKYGFY
jgi:hypothetical protein